MPSQLPKLEVSELEQQISAQASLGNRAKEFARG